MQRLRAKCSFSLPLAPSECSQCGSSSQGPLGFLYCCSCVCIHRSVTYVGFSVLLSACSPQAPWKQRLPWAQTERLLRGVMTAERDGFAGLCSEEGNVID